jgi:hypothetical protein
VQADWAGQVRPTEEAAEIHPVERGAAQMERRRDIEWPGIGVDSELPALDRSTEFEPSPAASQPSVSGHLFHSAHPVA